MTTSAQRLGDDDPDLADDAQEAIVDVADHPALEATARVGYAANAVMHLLIGVVAVGLAFGVEGSADQGGALALLTEHAWGKALLVLGTVGWAALTLWQLGEACLSFNTTSTRLKAASKGVTYATLSGLCVLTLVRGHGSSSSQENESLTAWALQYRPGMVLVVAIGVAIIGVGAYHVLKALRRSFLTDLREDPGPVVVAFGIVGYALKGIALVLTGAFVVSAAAMHDPHRAGGLDAAFHRMLAHRLGSVVVVAMGSGFIAYALYSAARARFARV